MKTKKNGKVYFVSFKKSRFVTPPEKKWRNDNPKPSKAVKK